MLIAMGLAALIAFGYQYKTGELLMNADQIAYQLLEAAHEKRRNLVLFPKSRYG